MFNCMKCEHLSYVEKEYTDDKVKCSYTGELKHMCGGQELIRNDLFYAPPNCPILLKQYGSSKMLEFEDNFYRERFNRTPYGIAVNTLKSAGIVFEPTVNGGIYITKNHDVILYYPSTGRWRKKGRAVWYKSKDPVSFVNKFIME